MDGTTYRTFALQGGTLAWMAPELFKGDPPSYQTDVYAYAIVAWEVSNKSICIAMLTRIFQLFAGSVPYRGYVRDAIPLNVSTGNMRPARPPKGALLGLSDDLWNFMELCWNTKPGDRPSMSSVVEVVRNAHRVYKPKWLPLADYPGHDNKEKETESLPQSLWPSSAHM